jgi:prophage maintenance system killer protein
LGGAYRWYSREYPAVFIRFVSHGFHRRAGDFSCPLVFEIPLWFHAVAGNHFFPDANHRTAVSTLLELLSQNDLEESVEWPTEQLVETIKESKRIRQTVTIDLGSLYERTRLYDHWL